MKSLFLPIFPALFALAAAQAGTGLVQTIRGNNVPGTGVSLVFYSYYTSNGAHCDDTTTGPIAPIKDVTLQTECPGNSNNFEASWFTCHNYELNQPATQLCIQTSINHNTGDNIQCCTDPGGNQPVISYDAVNGVFQCENGSNQSKNGVSCG